MEKKEHQTNVKQKSFKFKRVKEDTPHVNKTNYTNSASDLQHASHTTTTTGSNILITDMLITLTK